MKWERWAFFVFFLNFSFSNILESFNHSSFASKRSLEMRTNANRHVICLWLSRFWFWRLCCFGAIYQPIPSFQAWIEAKEELLAAYPPFINSFNTIKGTLDNLDMTNQRFHVFLKVKSYLEKKLIFGDTFKQISVAVFKCVFSQNKNLSNNHISRNQWF